MKQVLRSFVVLGALAATVVLSTGAYFSSVVTAPNNEINTGTLMIAVDSTRAHNYVGTWNTGVGLSWDGVTPVGVPFDAYNVVYDNNGTQVNVAPLEPWMNAAPGPYAVYAGGPGVIEDLADGNRSIWFTLRNWGTVDAKAQFALTGAWNNVRTSGTCPADEGSGDDSIIRVRNVHVYATNNCEGHEECENLYFSLNSFPGISNTNDPDLASAINVGSTSMLEGFNFYLSSNGANTGNEIALEAGEYAVVRVDLNFDPAIGGVNYNCYQGAQYLYDVTVTGNQLVDPIW